MMISLIDAKLGVVSPQTPAQPASAHPETLSDAFAALLRLLTQDASSTPAAPVASTETTEAAIESSAESPPETSGDEPPVDVEAPPEHGPPVHRGMPEVALPALALAHALHSNGAPFEAYRVADATPPPPTEAAIPPSSTPTMEGGAEVALVTNPPIRPLSADESVARRAVVPTQDVALKTRSQGANPQPKVMPDGVPSEPSPPKTTTPNPRAPESPLPIRPGVGALAAAADPPAVAAVDSELEQPTSAVPVGRTETRQSPLPADDGFLPAAATLHRAARAMQVVAAVADGTAPPEPVKQGAVRALEMPVKVTSPSEGILPAEPTADKVTVSEGDPPLRPTEFGQLQPRTQRAAEVSLPPPKPSALPEATPPLGKSSLQATPPAQSVEAGPTSGPTRPEAAQTAVSVEAGPSRGQSRVESAPAPAPVETSAPAGSLRSEAAPTAVLGSDQNRLPEVASSRSAAFAEVPDRPVNPVEHAAQTAMQHVRRLVFSGEQTLSVRLVPESLGELHITVTATRDAVEVVLASSNPQVRQALEQHVHTLRDALARDGLDLTRTTVTTPVNTENETQTAFARAGSSGQQGGPGRHAPGHSFSGYPHAREPDVPNPHRRSWTPADGRLNVLV